MCPTQQKMVERGCAGDCVINPNVVKNTILTAATIVIVFANLAWFLRAIEYIVIATGALTIGTALGIGYVKYMLRARRRRVAEMTATAQAAMQGRFRQTLPAQQQALPPGSVTNHYGHTLALPADWTPDQIRAFRGD